MVTNRPCSFIRFIAPALSGFSSSDTAMTPIILLFFATYKGVLPSRANFSPVGKASFAAAPISFIRAAFPMTISSPLTIPFTPCPERFSNFSGVKTVMFFLPKSARSPSQAGANCLFKACGKRDNFFFGLTRQSRNVGDDRRAFRYGARLVQNDDICFPASSRAVAVLNKSPFSRLFRFRP